MGDQMKKHKQAVFAVISLISLFILILDTKTTILGANQGIELCICALIPALFPFMLISTCCSNLLSNMRIRIFRLILRPCQLPDGSESIFLIGLLGGYPIGAKLIQEAYESKKITLADAERMSMFCSNAGPSFIFGILGTMFQEAWIPWAMWIIHALSAYIVGIITSRPSESSYREQMTKQLQITQAVSSAVKSMCTVCGWVILFRVILTFCEKWFLWRLSIPARVLLSGILELSNGCTQISSLTNSGVAFMVALLMVTFGGFCVAIQTAAIMPKIPLRHYLLGKTYQCMIASILAAPILIYLLPETFRMYLLIGAIILLATLIAMCKTSKKNNSSIPARNVV